MTPPSVYKGVSSLAHIATSMLRTMDDIKVEIKLSNTNQTTLHRGAS